MSEALGIGKIITTPQTRDAIHVAVVPVFAAEKLFPGNHVGISGPLMHAGRAFGAPVGIVDPYLTLPVEQGQEFWLFLYPGSVTSLRHVWTHPAFGNES